MSQHLAKVDWQWRESVPSSCKCLPTNRENKQHWVLFICSKVHAVWQHTLFVKTYPAGLSSTCYRLGLRYACRFQNFRTAGSLLKSPSECRGHSKEPGFVNTIQEKDGTWPLLCMNGTQWRSRNSCDCWCSAVIANDGKKHSQFKNPMRMLIHHTKWSSCQNVMTSNKNVKPGFGCFCHLTHIQML